MKCKIDSRHLGCIRHVVMLRNKFAYAEYCMCSLINFLFKIFLYTLVVLMSYPEFIN